MRAATIFLFLAASGVAHAEVPPTFDSLVVDLKLDDAAVKELRAGKNYQRFPQEVSDRDIAAGIVFLTRSTPSEVGKLFTHFADVTVNPSVRASHDISSAGDFASLTLGEHGAAEAQRYLAAKPGDELNLASDEIAQFHALGAGASQQQVEAVLRKVLAARWGAYRRMGLSGIAPYAREDGKKLRGGDELERVMALLPAKIVRYAPALARTIQAYPKREAGVKEGFRWIVYEQDGRPTVTLRQRLSLVAADGNVTLSDREFYVSQGYNVMQGFAGMFGLGAGASDGTMVLYRANTSTDRVEGSASGMKHSIGRKMMARELDAIFERFRNKLGN
ncbi:MAG: hypothetical protein ABI321_14160 [Polyangia bacterium]